MRYSALLHDIGHLPFSHSSEKALLGEEKEHEQLSSYIIKNHELINKILKKEKLKPDIIANIISGNYTPEFDIIRKIISGEFDADRTDYLLRDSYFCGVEYGRFDYQRFIDSFDLRNELEFKTYIKKKNIHSVESLVMARYHYYTQVVFHRTRMGYDTVFKNYLEENFQKESKKLLQDNIDINFWNKFDDCFVTERIKKDAESGDIWANMLLRINHLKPVFSTGSHATSQELRKVQRIQYVLKNEGFKKDKDFFVISKESKIHKLSITSDEDPGYKEKEQDKTEHYVVNEGEVKGKLTDFSSLLRKFKDPIHIVRIYTLPDIYDEINFRVEKIIQEESQIEREKI